MNRVKNLLREVEGHGPEKLREPAMHTHGATTNEILE